MTLVDTSVWIDHLDRSSGALSALLRDEEVLCHVLIIGELACGHLRNRSEILTLLDVLPRVEMVDHSEALGFVETHRLAGTGLGWIDVHLLAAARLARATLWTKDRRLHVAAERVGSAWREGEQ